MATYYKITNVSGGTEKGPRGIFLTEAGKLLRPGETAYNVRRLNPATEARKDLEVTSQSTPFKDVSDKPSKEEAAPSKVKHKVIEAPDGKVAAPPAPEPPHPAPEPEPAGLGDPPTSESAPSAEGPQDEEPVAASDEPSEGTSKDDKKKKRSRKKKGSSSD